MAVDFTGLRIAKGPKVKELYSRMLDNYRLYERLEGRDPVAKKDNGVGVRARPLRGTPRDRVAFCP
nr:hypothetical protein [Thermococcus guaymasensis]